LKKPSGLSFNNKSGALIPLISSANPVYFISRPTTRPLGQLHGFAKTIDKTDSWPPANPIAVKDQHLPGDYCKHIKKSIFYISKYSKKQFQGKSFLAR